MAELKFSKEDGFDVIIADKTYSIRKPTVMEQANFEEKFSELADSKKPVKMLSYLIEYLDALGLPKAVSETLYQHQIFKVLSEITGADKKK